MKKTKIKQPFLYYLKIRTLFFHYNGSTGLRMLLKIWPSMLSIKVRQEMEEKLKK